MLSPHWWWIFGAGAVTPLTPVGPAKYIVTVAAQDRRREIVPDRARLVIVPAPRSGPVPS